MKSLEKLQAEVVGIINAKRLKEKKEMNDLVTSLIRTYVPSVAGALLAWLLTLGVQVDENTRLGLVTALTGLLTALYYTVVRLLEKKFPKVGILLGATKTPSYEK